MRGALNACTGVLPHLHAFADGELRGIIGLTTDGVPVMQFLDAKGNPMLTIPERLPESDAADEGL